jgi:hypothetical protein
MLVKQNTTPTFTIVCDIPVSGVFSNAAPSSYSYVKAGGSLTAGTGSLVNSQPSGNSAYLASITLAAGEADTLGDLFLAVLDSSGNLIGALNFDVVAFDPQDATALGLAALPSHSAGASGGLWVLGSNAGNASFSGTLTLAGGLQITPGVWIHGVGTGSGNNVATLYIEATGGNAAGLEIDGNGTNASTVLVAGATGPGVKIGGGSTSGAGVAITNTTGDVVTVTAAAGNGNAVNLTGQGTGAGLKAVLTDLATSAVNDILDAANGVETSFTLRQALRLILSALAGKLSGAGTTSIAIRDINDTKDRIDATVDASGNRTAVTTNVS